MRDRTLTFVVDHDAIVGTGGFLALRRLHMHNRRGDGSDSPGFVCDFVHRPYGQDAVVIVLWHRDPHVALRMERTDAKALAGIKSFILDNPLSGSTGGLSRSGNSWWRTDAATTAYAGAGGQGPITSAAADGGALIEFMDKAKRRRSKYASGATKTRYFCGSAFIDAYKKELRANGSYSQTGWTGQKPDGSMADPSHGGLNLGFSGSGTGNLCL